MDPPQSTSADGDVLFPVRHCAQTKVRRWQLRAVFPGRNPAMAGIFRSRGPLAQHHAGISKLRKEAGVPSGNPADESGDLGRSDRSNRRSDLHARIALFAPRPPLVSVVAARADHPPTFIDGRPVLVSSRVGSIFARLGTNSR